jgi:hypothetical protein
MGWAITLHGVIGLALDRGRDARPLWLAMTMGLTGSSVPKR